jgi:hypothetical protein
MDEDYELVRKSSSSSIVYVNAFTFGYVATMLLLATVVIIYLLTRT